MPWGLRSLFGPRAADPAYAYLSEDRTSEGEVWSLAASATSFDREEARLTALAAVPVRGNRILLTRRFERAVAAGEERAVVAELLPLIAGRPLIGYYLEFPLGLIDREVRALAGIDLPNPRTDVSSLYYGQRIGTAHHGRVDLRFDAILEELDLPARKPPGPLADAVSAALIWLKLSRAG
jgi:DNA polymerase-3 subunit epsilon